ncbi:protein-export chaperone SecB [Lactiplantibacillus pentosus]|uniref:protein-export chaperone SecB n=1 Tax=Lactiplantibacillus pentosus TaxID=1589 RepID=UPI00259AFE41|nr:protein-export chaperone SecB [Lactiplantibacillus pentosus]WFC04754.1 protein-export chaperone SecB [Lactiplantibacillus pentosus]
MDVLQFNGYRVENMSYQRNDQYRQTSKQIIFSPEISSDIEKNGNNISVSLTVVVGALDKTETPFQATCSLVGSFVYNPEEDKANIGLNTLVQKNAVAILYPYIRAIISMLANSSNEFPGFNLPTINVSDALAKQND